MNINRYLSHTDQCLELSNYESLIIRSFCINENEQKVFIQNLINNSHLEKIIEIFKRQTEISNQDLRRLNTIYSNLNLIIECQKNEMNKSPKQRLLSYIPNSSYSNTWYALEKMNKILSDVKVILNEKVKEKLSQFSIDNILKEEKDLYEVAKNMLFQLPQESEIFHCLGRYLVSEKLYTFWTEYIKEAVTFDSIDSISIHLAKVQLEQNTVTTKQLNRLFKDFSEHPATYFDQTTTQFLCSGTGILLKDLCERYNHTILSSNKENTQYLQHLYKTVKNREHLISSAPHLSDLLNQLNPTLEEDKDILNILRVIWLHTLWNLSEFPIEERSTDPAIFSIASQLTSSDQPTTKEILIILKNKFPFVDISQLTFNKTTTYKSDLDGNIDFAYASPLGFSVVIDGSGHDKPDLKKIMEKPIFDFNKNLEYALIINRKNLKCIEDIKEFLNKHLSSLALDLNAAIGEDPSSYPSFSFCFVYPIKGTLYLFYAQAGDSILVLSNNQEKEYLVTKSNCIGTFQHVAPLHLQDNYIPIKNSKYSVILPSIQHKEIMPNMAIYNVTDGIGEFLTKNEFEFLISNTLKAETLLQNLKIYITNKAIFTYEGRIPYHISNDQISLAQLSIQQMQAILEGKTDDLPILQNSSEWLPEALKVDNGRTIVYAKQEEIEPNRLLKLKNDFLNKFVRKNSETLNGDALKILWLGNRGYVDDISIATFKVNL